MRAQSAKEPVQGMRRGEHLRARSDPEPLQGMRRWQHLPARSEKEQVQDVHSRQGRVHAAGSRGALGTPTLDSANARSFCPPLVLSDFRIRHTEISCAHGFVPDLVNFPYLCRDAVFPIQPTYTFQAFAMAWPLASLHTFAVFQYKPTLSSLRGLPIQTNAPRQNRTSMRSAAQAIEFLHRRKVSRERLLCQQPTTRAAVYYHQALAQNTIHNKSPAPPKNKIDQ